jgi:hypothetical protein
MKTSALIVSALLCCTALAYAQQDNEQPARQPPVITEKQVEKHAEMATQERKKTEAEKKLTPVKQEKEKQRQKDLKITSGTQNTLPTKKSSNTPEGQ